jgi:hypothetical protein
MPVANGLLWITTGPSWVKNRLWQAGRNQIFRVTPACRNVSARYGNPPAFGRMDAARFKAASKFSIALPINISFHNQGVIGIDEIPPIFVRIERDG